MKNFFIAVIASIAFLMILSAISSATNIGNVFLSKVPESAFFSNPNGSLRLSVLQEVNRVRAACGFPPYQMHPALMESAQRSAQATAGSGQPAGHPFGLEGPHGFRYFQQNSVGAVSNAREAVNGWWHSGREDYGGPGGCAYIRDNPSIDAATGKIAYNQGGHRSNLLAHPVYKYAEVGAFPIKGGYTITLDIGG